MQDFNLLFEGWRADRVLVAVEFLVGALGRCGVAAGIALRDRSNGLCRALQRRNRKIACMRVADRFAGDGAKAETLLGIEASALEAAIVEHQRFRLRMLDEELAVIGAGKRLGNVFAHRRFVGVEQRRAGRYS